MGKGDKRTKRGKLFRGSRGKSVPGKSRAAAAKPEVKPAAARVPKPPREKPAAPPTPLEPAEPTATS
jgi:30S ribosomal protein S31